MKIHPDRGEWRGATMKSRKSKVARDWFAGSKQILFTPGSLEVDAFLTFKVRAAESAYSKWLYNRNQRYWTIMAIGVFANMAAFYTVWFTSGAYFQPDLQEEPADTMGSKLVHDLIGFLVGTGFPAVMTIIFNNALPKRIAHRTIHYFLLLNALAIPIVSVNFRVAIYNSTRGIFTPWTLAFLLCVCILAIPSFFRLRFLYSLVSGIAVIVAYSTSYAVGCTQVKLCTGPEFLFTVILTHVWLLLSVIVSAYACYEHERNERSLFCLNYELEMVTFMSQELHGRLTNLAQTYEDNELDFDSPLEKSINCLRGVMAEHHLPPAVTNQLHKVIGWLLAEDVLHPTFGSEAGKSGFIDEDAKALLGIYMKARSLEWAPSLDSGVNAEEEDIAASSEDVKAVGDKASASTNLAHASSSHSLSVPTGDAVARRSTAPLHVKHLQQYESWKWSIFELEAAAGGRPLYLFAHHVFTKSKLPQRLKVSTSKLRAFLRQIESGYRNDIPYHNGTHAADVLHAVTYLIRSKGACELLEDLDHFAVYIAAIIHDYDHPGVNNNFLIATSDQRAIRYNDRSVLENHHVSSAFTILNSEECNFFHASPKEMYRAFRSLVIDMVMATDMSTHFSLLSNLRNKMTAAGGSLDMTSSESKSLLLQVMIKSADIANVTRPWALYEKWMQRAMDEFFLQGDKEKAAGIPLSPFMDRETAVIPIVQMNFIDFICIPFFETVSSVLALDEQLQNLEENRAKVNAWRAKVTGVSAPDRPVRKRSDYNEQQSQRPSVNPGGSSSPSGLKSNNGRKESQQQQRFRRPSMMPPALQKSSESDSQILDAILIEVKDDE